MTTPRSSPAHRVLPGTITAADANRWATKAHLSVQPLLQLPHAPAAPAVVEVVAHDTAADGPFGGLMLTWPEARTDRQLIHHLPDGILFLQLLERVYAPVFQQRPQLRHLLNNRTRLEMAVTNDVLQVQIVPGDGVYSMIRHHALMLFEATLWLEHDSRAAWGELYSAVADLAMTDRRRAPTVTELADLEAAGFEAMLRSAPKSIDPSDWNDLLRDPALQPVLTYQLWATAALAVLWRDYRTHDATREMAWHDRQLGSYQDESYLAGGLRKWL